MTRGGSFGHLAYAVDDIYAVCSRLQAAGVTINRPPRDGRMAFVRSPDGHSVELLQSGGALAAQEPCRRWRTKGLVMKSTVALVVLLGVALAVPAEAGEPFVFG